MSKKKKSNFFSKFFKNKKNDTTIESDEIIENFDDEFESTDIYEEKYHSDDNSKVDIQLDEPDEVFDATEITTSNISTHINNLEDPEVTGITEVTTQFQNNFGDSAEVSEEDSEEVFPIEETPPIAVNNEGEVIPNLPSEDDLAEPTISQHPLPTEDNDFDGTDTDIEDSVEKELQTTNSDEFEKTEAVKQTVDLDAIKNYELTSDDDVPEETFAAYKLITKKENKGIKAFFDKGKCELGKVFKGDYKNILKNVKRPKNLKSSKILKNINFDKVIEGLYSPHSRKQIHKAFLATMIIGGTYSTGKTIALSLKGTPNTSPKGVSRIQSPSELKNVTADVNSIKSSNIFNALMNENEVTTKVDAPKQINENILCQSSNRASSLPLKLQNTLVLQDSVKSIASVQIRSNKIPLNVREGEKLENIAKVGRIGRLKLIFKNLKTGECEFIENKAKKPKISTKNLTILNPRDGKKLIDQTKNANIKNEGNVFNIKKSVRDEMLSNISEVLTQARAVQIKNPDGSYSFKMTEIVPGSIYSKLGIVDGDIVSEIDGKKITNLNEIMSKFGTIKDKDQFSLGIKRNGTTETKEYNFD